MLKTVIDKIQEFHKLGSKVYIYGAGTYGNGLYKLICDAGSDVDGFVITKTPSDDRTCFGKKVASLAAVDLDHAAFILAMNETNTNAVRKTLAESSVSETRIFDARPLIEHGGLKRGTQSGSVEVTTNIGCSVNCRYCPQKLLLGQYFKDDKKKASQMTKEMFERILEFFPEDYDISFGGMSEPFLNKEAVDMIELACQRGRYVAVYTTLVGLDKKALEKLISLPISWCTLHVADKYDYAKISKTDEYYELVEMILKARKADGDPLTNMCNAQAEPDDKVCEICKKYGYEVFSEMTDRAGNLSEDNLIQNNIATGKVICGNSKNNELNSNIVLPDGSVVLCCMDYGLKHVLGNITTDTFEMIRNGEMMQYVRAGMNGDTTKDILCRHCSMAHVG